MHSSILLTRRVENIWVIWCPKYRFYNFLSDAWSHQTLVP